MVVLRSIALAAAAALFATSASAHVSVQPATAGAGAYQVLRFGVGHGCRDKADTTALRVEIPAGVTVARPQPKPGWVLQIVRDGETVTALVWTGRLPPDQFDEFVVLTKLPDAGGPLAFPAIQSCGAEQNRWTEVTPPGAPRSKFPAPILNVITAAPEGGHDHQH
ncbi:YcnI family protein [Phenylobacterium sp.]|uniref:YcnI family copper-binding membrane protein n=1 Tax=Phenylobacterium sp. TaxID=1871053 RepID=UPI0025EF1958|nr:YcnI family protein [Phenylobacterium sp.]